MNRIRSSRSLEALARVNVEVMWLLEKVVPDDRCIADFRKDNSAAIKKVFREFSLMCSRLGLYGGKDVSVDSTKIRTNANWHSVHTKQGTEADGNNINQIVKRLHQTGSLYMADVAEVKKLLHDVWLAERQLLFKLK